MIARNKVVLQNRLPEWRCEKTNPSRTRLARRFVPRLAAKIHWEMSSIRILSRFQRSLNVGFDRIRIFETVNPISGAKAAPNS